MKLKPLMAVLLSTISASVLAPGGTAGADPGTAARNDVYIRDTAGDTGVEPNSFPELWKSPDIRICNLGESCIASPPLEAGKSYTVWVTLRNPGPYGSGAASGVVELYRTKPGGAASWGTDDFVSVGGGAATVPDGVAVEVPITFRDVPGPGHFCLVAVWRSANDPMQSESPDIAATTRMNNNIAWRNVDSVPGKTGITVLRPYFIGNPYTGWTINTINFTPVGTPFQSRGGRVIVDLGPVLFDRWRRGNPTGGPGLGYGFTQVGPTHLMMNSPQARLDGIRLNPRERLGMTLMFAAAAPSAEVSTLKVVQHLHGTSADLGGVQYNIQFGQN